MQININNQVDANIIKIQKSIANNLRNSDLFVSDKKDTANNVAILKPPIPFKDCEYVFLNSSYVSKCCKILAKDIVLNTLTLSNDDDPKYDKKIPMIEQMLVENQTELYNLLVDYYYAGCGALEYAYDNHNFSLKQIPINTCKIIIIRIGQKDYYLLEQKVQSKTNYFKILGEKYPKNFDMYENQVLGECALIGGDNFYQFFSIPLWVQEKDKILTEMAISNKNYNAISNGNIASGILHINLEPQMMKPMEYDTETGEIIETKSREEIISEELESSDSGIAVIFTESNRNLTMDFTKIENDNYSYLEAQQEKAEQAVLNCYNIPLARLMINTEKESMNSNKTQSIWEIYTLDLKTEQIRIKEFIKELIYDLYTIKVNVDIEVPIFSDRREIEIGNIIDEWNNGLLTLKQAIVGLSEYTSVININEYDFTANPDLWDYRKIPELYSFLNEVDLLKLEEIEDEINNID